MEKDASKNENKIVYIRMLVSFFFSQFVQCVQMKSWVGVKVQVEIGIKNRSLQSCKQFLFSILLIF